MPRHSSQTRCEDTKDEAERNDLIVHLVLRRYRNALMYSAARPGTVLAARR
ncbi:hypothetical protein SAMN05421595_1057 [Austwickia chelonae]|nr:hypothetical protein SAMN05421595_1057 [Austwickia chelonae]